MPVKKRKTAKRKTTARKTTTRKTAVRKTAKRKTAVRKTAKRKTATRKTAKRKTAVKKVVAVKTITDKLTSSQLYTMIAERTELSKKQVLSVFEEMSNIMEGCLKKRGVGEFSLPKLAKFVVKHKPATKARKGINPFTGEEIMIKAKPARRVVKVRPLKKVKEMAG